MLLKDRVAVVTGAAQGLGYAIGEALLGEGARVVVADLQEAAARAAAESLGGEASALACDVANEDSVSTMFEGVLAKHGRVDVLVNNAGITRDAMMHKMTLGEFRQVIDVHLQGTWLCSRAALIHMRSRDGGGAIVNLSSIAGKVGNLGQTNYSAAKAGIVGLTKATAREGARFAIRANAIMPGVIRTPMTEAMPPEMFDEKVADVPLGRAGKPSDVASVAVFLASDMSAYVTGTAIEVSGGRHM